MKNRSWAALGSLALAAVLAPAARAQSVIPSGGGGVVIVIVAPGQPTAAVPQAAQSVVPTPASFVPALSMALAGGEAGTAQERLAALERRLALLEKKISTLTEQTEKLQKLIDRLERITLPPPKGENGK
jgi:hypothetical protein